METICICKLHTPSSPSKNCMTNQDAQTLKNARRAWKAGPRTDVSMENNLSPDHPRKEWPKRCLSKTRLQRRPRKLCRDKIVGRRVEHCEGFSTKQYVCLLEFSPLFVVGFLSPTHRYNTFLYEMRRSRVPGNDPRTFVES